jgi:hypothetical protein
MNERADQILVIRAIIFNDSLLDNVNILHLSRLMAIDHFSRLAQL